MSDFLDDCKFVALVSLPFITVIAVVVGIAIYDLHERNEKYNDGYCKCGGNWVYTQAVGHNVSTGYIYVCDKCGDVVELDEKR